MTRVVLAHDALQLGELADHQGTQVRLRQSSRSFNVGDVQPEFARDPDGDTGDALDAFELRAELVVVNDVRQTREAALECLPAILVIEELRISQPCAHDPCVAGHDRLGIVGIDVRHQQEAVDQRTPLALEREVLLVLLHRQDQALLWHQQKFRIEVGRVHRGPFDERRDFVEQFLGRDDRGAEPCALACQLLLDARAACCERWNYLALVLHLLDVGVGRVQCDFALAHEAMALRLSAGGQSQRMHRNDLMSVQRH